MSTVHKDISKDLLEGVFSVLESDVTVNGLNYSVYKSLPKVPDMTYVWVGNIIHDQDGDKDNFRYYGTIQIQVVDESEYRADRKLAQDILNRTRALLKPTVVGMPTVSGLVTFTPSTFNDASEISDNNISRVKLVDMYDFIME
jgi:hypothetical protein